MILNNKSKISKIINNSPRNKIMLPSRWLVNFKKSSTLKNKRSKILNCSLYPSLRINRIHYKCVKLFQISSLSNKLSIIISKTLIKLMMSLSYWTHSQWTSTTRSKWSTNSSRLRMINCKNKLKKQRMIRKNWSKWEHNLHKWWIFELYK